MNLWNKFKNMIITNLYDNTYVFNFILFFCSLLSVELIVRLINGYTIVGFAFLRIVLLLIITCYITTFFLNFCKSSIRKVITAIFVFIGSAYACFQLGFLNYIGVYASIQNSSQAGAVSDFFMDFIKSFKLIYLTTFIPFVALVLIYAFVKKRFYRNNRFRLMLSTIVMVSLFGCIYYEFITDKSYQNPLQSIDNEQLFLTASNSSLTVSEFGIFGYGMTDLRNKFFPVEIKTNLMVTNKNHYSSNDSFMSGIDDSMWQYLINTEEDENYNFLNNYYYNRRKATVNDHTGLFKDKNLIVIMMESANDIFIEYPEYFPNIAKLYNGGWSWENFYSPKNGCSTLNNEFSGMTSLYSINDICTAREYSDNSYFESIFSVFKDSSYNTFSAHDYTEHYYPRSKIHANMGSDHYYGVEELGMEYNYNAVRNWGYDDEFTAKVLDIIDTLDTTEGNFMSWLTTVSSHGLYNEYSKTGNAFYSMTEGRGFDIQIRRYMSKLKILDNALGVLINGLKSRGLLDDTVIVLYGDHYPYYIDNVDKSILPCVMSYDTRVDHNFDQVPFIIYNSEITEESPYIYTDYASNINILPTIANLFGLKYETRLYNGEDLFSDSYQSLAVFPDGSWKNEYGYFDAPTASMKYYSSFEYTMEELKEINDLVSLKLTTSTMTVKSNYFAHLKERIDLRMQELDKLSEDACLMTENTLYLEANCNRNEESDSETKEETIE